MLYRPGKNNKHNKVRSSMAFKLDIPKGATIDNAIFTCTTTEAATIPTYTIYFRRSSPVKSLKFLKDCQYKNVLTMSHQSTSWNFNTPDVESGAEISSTKIVPLIQDFVDHSKYNPGVYFQLVILNTLVSSTKSSDEVDTITCVCDNDDKKKRPRLYIEWSV